MHAAVESLMYTIIQIRADIAQVVGMVSCFLENSSKRLWSMVKDMFISK